MRTKVLWIYPQGESRKVGIYGKQVNNLVSTIRREIGYLSVFVETGAYPKRRITKKSMKTKRIAKMLGVSLVAVLAFSLGALSLPVSADPDPHEWSTINTPSWEDNVILPGSDLRDMAIGGNGDVVYVVARLDNCSDGRDRDLCESVCSQRKWD